MYRRPTRSSTACTLKKTARSSRPSSTLNFPLLQPCRALQRADYIPRAGSRQLIHSDIPLFADEAKTILNSMSACMHIALHDSHCSSWWTDGRLWDLEQYADSTVVVEVPRWTNAKLEISKEESFNPIKQGTFFPCFSLYIVLRDQLFGPDP